MAIQTVECSDCGFQGIAVYEESRRGAGESWHHVYERVMLDIQSKSRGGLSDYLMGEEPSFHMHTAASTGDAYDGER